MREIQSRWTLDPAAGTVTLPVGDAKRVLLELHDQWQWGEALEQAANWER